VLEHEPKKIQVLPHAKKFIAAQSFAKAKTAATTLGRRIISPHKISENLISICARADLIIV